VLPEVPKDLQDYDTVSESELRGHLLGDGEKKPDTAAPTAPKTAATAPKPDASPDASKEGGEGQGIAGALASYVPDDPKLDKQLNYALDLLNGVQVNAAFPASTEQGVPN
jgi:hypothetical protein